MKVLKSIVWVAVGALVAAVPLALAQQSQVGKADSDAMKKLAQGNLAEIETGKLAVSKAQSDDVKKFAQRMVDDHGKMLEDLQNLASSKGVALPSAPSSKDRAAMKKLERLSGDQFDRRYIADMVEDHQKDVKESDKIARQAKDAEFKEAVKQANGVMKEHLQMAQQIAGGNIPKGASTGASLK